MIPIKSQDQIERMREACRVAAEVLDALKGYVRPGISTFELDQIAKNLIFEGGAVSACHNYKVGSRRFPSYSCLSVNEEVVHGIGSINRVLQEGDVVALDVVVSYQGFIGDNACTVPVGEVPAGTQKLLEVTEEALRRGIARAVAGKRVGDISSAVQRHVESNGFSVVREFVGHGVGVSMHEEPQIPNFGRPGTGPKLRPGMTLAIEPMVNLGGPEVEVLADGWTVTTRDRTPSAHFEHTVLITEGAPEVLTVPVKKPMISG
ncbi:MAG: type I methionyl aminopeptidase [Opitutaceae bacterium]